MKTPLLVSLSILAALPVLMTSCGGETTSPAESKTDAVSSPETSEPIEIDTSITDKGDAQAGAETYKKVCIACHQADGTGMNGMLAANFVKDTARLQQSDTKLLEIIAEGKTGKTGLVMPPQKGNLSKKEIIDVLTYIRQTFGKK